MSNDDRGERRVLEDDPLRHALAIQESASAVGFDWPEVSPVLDKVAEELDEIREALLHGEQARVMDEIGDAFFALINVARHCKVCPSSALAHANLKFAQRLHIVERIASERHLNLRSLTPDALDDLWRQAKRERGS